MRRNVRRLRGFLTRATLIEVPLEGFLDGARASDDISASSADFVGLPDSEIERALEGTRGVRALSATGLDFVVRRLKRRSRKEEIVVVVGLAVVIALYKRARSEQMK